MVAIVPKGFKIDEYPRDSDTIEDIDQREQASKRLALEDSKKTLLYKINKTIEQHNGFFIAHFGTNPVEGLIKTHLVDASNQWKGITTGGPALGVVNEIMLYQSPTPSEFGVTQPILIGIIYGLIEIHTIDTQLTALSVGNKAINYKSIYTLEKRPTAEALKDVKINNQLNRPALPSTLLGWSLMQRHLTGYSNSAFANLNTGLKQKTHSTGFILYPEVILQFYEEAYKGTPQTFWDFMSKHRIGMEVNGTNLFAVIYRVDQITGAPITARIDRNQDANKVVASVTAANFSQKEDAFLGNVKLHLFPELYTLQAGVNISVENRKEVYKKELDKVLSRWESVSDKARTRITMVAFQEWKGTANDLSPNPVGGTSQAVSTIKFYLQPTGREEALVRILNGEIIEKWWKSKFTWTETSQTPIMFEATQEELLAMRQEYDNTIEMLYLVLSAPGIYHNISWGNVIPSGHRFWGLQENQRRQLGWNVGDILRLAGWNTSVRPELLLSVPVNDLGDAETTIAMFFNYLRDNSEVSPIEMYLPDSLNVAMREYLLATPPTAQSSAQGNKRQYKIEFDRTRVEHINTHSPSRIIGRTFGQPRVTHRKERRIFVKGITAIKKINMGSSGFGINLPKQVKLVRPQAYESIAKPKSLAAVRSEEAVAIGVLGTVVIGLGVAIWKLR